MTPCTSCFIRMCFFQPHNCRTYVHVRWLLRRLSKFLLHNSHFREAVGGRHNNWTSGRQSWTKRECKLLCILCCLQNEERQTSMTHSSSELDKTSAMIKQFTVGSYRSLFHILQALHNQTLFSLWIANSCGALHSTQTVIPQLLDFLLHQLLHVWHAGFSQREHHSRRPLDPQW